MNARDLQPHILRLGWVYIIGHALFVLIGVLQSRIASSHPKLATATEIRNGDAVHGIEEAVALLEVALLFMATHGRTGARRAVLGSVAGKLLQESDVPVVLLRPV